MKIDGWDWENINCSHGLLHHLKFRWVIASPSSKYLAESHLYNGLPKGINWLPVPLHVFSCPRCLLCSVYVHVGVPLSASCTLIPTMSSMFCVCQCWSTPDSVFLKHALCHCSAQTALIFNMAKVCISFLYKLQQ